MFDDIGGNDDHHYLTFLFIMLYLRASEITFIRYAHDQKIAKPNNLEVFWSK